MHRRCLYHRMEIAVFWGVIFLFDEHEESGFEEWDLEVVGELGDDQDDGFDCLFEVITQALLLGPVSRGHVCGDLRRGMLEEEGVRVGHRSRSGEGLEGRFDELRREDRYDCIAKRMEDRTAV